MTLESFEGAEALLWLVAGLGFSVLGLEIGSGLFKSGCCCLEFIALGRLVSLRLFLTQLVFKHQDRPFFTLDLFQFLLSFHLPIDLTREGLGFQIQPLL